MYSLIGRRRGNSSVTCIFVWKIDIPRNANYTELYTSVLLPIGVR